MRRRRIERYGEDVLIRAARRLQLQPADGKGAVVVNGDGRLNLLDGMSGAVEACMRDIERATRRRCAVSAEDLSEDVVGAVDTVIADPGDDEAAIGKSRDLGREFGGGRQIGEGEVE